MWNIKISIIRDSTKFIRAKVIALRSVRFGISTYLKIIFSKSAISHCKLWAEIILWSVGYAKMCEIIIGALYMAWVELK